LLANPLSGSIKLIELHEMLPLVIFKLAYTDRLPQMIRVEELFMIKLPETDIAPPPCILNKSLPVKL
jgi:hypothetical protein